MYTNRSVMLSLNSRGRHLTEGSALGVQVAFSPDKKSSLRKWTNSTIFTRPGLTDSSEML